MVAAIRKSDLFQVSASMRTRARSGINPSQGGKDVEMIMHFICIDHKIQKSQFLLKLLLFLQASGSFRSIPYFYM